MSLVMVIEDNRTLRTMYAASLSGYGFEVSEAKSLAEAKAHLEAGIIPQAILLDVQLPDGSGEEIIRYVREQMGRADIRIVVATAREVNPEQLFQLGANAILSKPAEFALLVRELEGPPAETGEPGISSPV